ncbi:HNH endonuclease [Pseudomonas sp. DP-17]|uniref:HNH endonuclease n=1 Tax=Pseudomonas sp. DP-17 TaxID=1580486 RepID=UPI001EFA7813|nr:HNH endonuclease [Pseudomonas sp. DP-17]MCG8911314.1 HNH endonuclease [Pseudomonas sp. DP-17]
MPAVIAENDVSVWSDETGAVYHYPKRYSSILLPGAQVIYYKGKLTDKAFADQRLSTQPHYFGVARIGKVYSDPKSSKGDLFALIEDFQPFEWAILAKEGDSYLEPISPSKISNYWRSGVREISQHTFDDILSRAKIKSLQISESLEQEDAYDFKSRVEGSPIAYYGVRYERDPKLRTQAIAIHGLSCKACGFDFEKAYGSYAKGYIHVHHTMPISEFDGPMPVNPETDLVTLCANCHSVVHRKRSSTLSLDELKGMIRGLWLFKERS